MDSLEVERGGGGGDVCGGGEGGSCWRVLSRAGQRREEAVTQIHHTAKAQGSEGSYFKVWGSAQHAAGGGGGSARHGGHLNSGRTTGAAGATDMRPDVGISHAAFSVVFKSASCQQTTSTANQMTDGKKNTDR